MESLPIDTITIVIVAGSFLAAVANAVFSAGGALIVLAATTTVLPIQAIVPIHSTLLIGSTASRVYFFREHIDWKIAGFSSPPPLDTTIPSPVESGPLGTSAALVPSTVSPEK